MMSDPVLKRNEALARLDRFPRTRLTFLPTPLVELRRLGQALGGPRLVMKRDDLTGLGLGGNKTRKLEFLLGEALAQGCDAVVTGGATQSNHCRQTAAAAAAAGLECHLSLGGTALASPSGNLLLDLLFGAVVHWCGEDRKGERIPEIAEGLRAKGRVPYVIPYGGSNAVGALGFVAAIVELEGQLKEQGLQADRLVVASSSGGTHAGMAVGLDLCGLAARVVVGSGSTREGRARGATSPGSRPWRTRSPDCSISSRGTPRRGSTCGRATSAEGTGWSGTWSGRRSGSSLGTRGSSSTRSTPAGRWEA